MTVRFFLGVGEAAIAPGFTLITGMFYQREEQPLRYVFPIGSPKPLLMKLGNLPGSSEIALLCLLVD